MGRRAIVLLVALILAGLAAWAVWNFMQNVRDEASAGQEKVTVYRAGPDGIAEGTEGSILVSDFNNNGTLIEKGEDEVEDTPADAIQTDEELHFSNWEEAVTFIRRFVPLEPQEGQGSA